MSPVKLLAQVAHQVRYRYRLRSQKRENRVYSQFCRFPHQYQVLRDKVLPDLLHKEPSLRTRPLEIVVFACCGGEEAYTLSYFLRRDFPNQKLRIRGFDIVERVVEQARRAEYEKDHVYAGPFVNEEFVSGLFDDIGDSSYRIKPAYVEGTSFDVGDMTNVAFMRNLGKADFVFAQNVLFHLPLDVAPIAFENLFHLLLPHGSMFINGMDMDMRAKLTKKFNLEPIVDLIEEIHEDARVDRGEQWSNQYWGRAPFSNSSKNWQREFGTIFTRGELTE